MMTEQDVRAWLAETEKDIENFESNYTIWGYANADYKNRLLHTKMTLETILGLDEDSIIVYND